MPDDRQACIQILDGGTRDNLRHLHGGMDHLRGYDCRSENNRMTPSEAYAAGRKAWLSGLNATANPHDDWTLGVAWASGWEGLTRPDKTGNGKSLGRKSVLTEQFAMIADQIELPKGVDTAE